LLVLQEVCITKSKQNAILKL